MYRYPSARRLFAAWVVFIGLTAGSGGLYAAGPAPWANGGSRAEDLAIRLVTIGPGDPIYSWWGHTALIVEDNRLGQARFYNYGLFSFERSDFALNFAMGRLWFEVGAGDAARELDGYRRENRDIRIQTLNLPPAGRLAVGQALEESILPENRTYLYDHYADNCTTRVRDLLDRTTGGQLAAAAAGPGRMTLRQHTRRFTSGQPLTERLLMFLMSGQIDRPITRWEEMFLPSELERSVDQLVYRDESGTERPLVLDSAVIHRAAGRRPVHEGPPPVRPAGVLPGLVLAFPAALLGAWQRRGGKAARFAFGAFNVLFGLAFGLLGSVLFFMSVFTDHSVTYGNLNLLLANPLTLAVAGLGWSVAAGREGARRWLARLWGLLAGLALILLILKALPGVAQQDAATALAIAPALFSMAAVLNLPGRSKAASGRVR